MAGYPALYLIIAGIPHIPDTESQQKTPLTNLQLSSLYLAIAEAETVKGTVSEVFSSFFQDPFFSLERHKNKYIPLVGNDSPAETGKVYQLVWYDVEGCLDKAIAWIVENDDPVEQTLFRILASPPGDLPSDQKSVSVRSFEGDLIQLAEFGAKHVYRRKKEGDRKREVKRLPAFHAVVAREEGSLATVTPGMEQLSLTGEESLTEKAYPLYAKRQLLWQLMDISIIPLAVLVKRGIVARESESGRKLYVDSEFHNIEGGMSELKIWKNSSSKLLLKISEIKSSADFRAACRELLVLHHLEHPNIVQHMGGYILESPGSRRLIIQVIRYYDSTDMTGYLQKADNDLAGNNENIREVSRILAELLAWLHHHGIAYMDGKPDNIIILQGAVEWRERIKLCDFGIACSISSSSRARGTIAWLAPELFSPPLYWQPTKVDAWSLGAITFAMHKVRMIWDETILNVDCSAGEVKGQHKKLLRNIDRGLPGGEFASVRSFLKSALEIEPDKRPTVTELLKYPFLLLPKPVGQKLKSPSIR